MIPGLIFDLDDTLYPERQFIRSGFAAVAHEVERQWGVPAATARGVLLRALRRGQRRSALQTLCFSCDLPLVVIPDLIQVIRNHTPSLQLPDASVRVLERARANGWRIGILTNGLPEIQARKVRALGVDRLVDAVVYAQEWGSGRGKPEKETFEVVRSWLGTRAAHTVFVGDDPWCDVSGARAAGLHTVLLRKKQTIGSAGAASRMLTSLDDVMTTAAELICREVADAA